jgi:hypothetical protein
MKQENITDLKKKPQNIIDKYFYVLRIIVKIHNVLWVIILAVILAQLRTAIKMWRHGRIPARNVGEVYFVDLFFAICSINYKNINALFAFHAQ